MLNVPVRSVRHDEQVSTASDTGDVRSVLSAWGAERRFLARVKKYGGCT